MIHAVRPDNNRDTAGTGSRLYATKILKGERRSK